MTLPIFTPVRNPDAKAKKTVRPRVLSAAFGDGYSQSSPDGLNSVREEWDLTWSYLGREDAIWLDNFLKVCAGSQVFLYQIPGMRQQLKWTCAEWDYELDAAPGLDTITAKFKQSFNLDT